MNNSLTAPLRVRQADLTVTKVTWTPANPVAGTPVKFIAAVKNLGDAPTPSGTIVEVQFIVDAQIVNTSTYFSSSIPAGTTVYLGATNGPHGPTWTATSGTHFVRGTSTLRTALRKATKATTERFSTQISSFLERSERV